MLYNTPTLKANVLHVASNEGWLERILLLYNTALPWSSLAITGDAFCYFYSYNTPTFKTKALDLVSNGS